MNSKEVQNKSLEQLLDDVERMESDFRLGKISEDEITEYMVKLAEQLKIPVGEDV